jgi:hypothetical protein
MPIPLSAYHEAEALLDEYCRTAIPSHAQSKIRIGHYAKGMLLTIFTERPYFRDANEWIRSDIARFRYNKSRDDWTLYWCDRNSKWHVYELIESSHDFAEVFEEVKKDPTGIFWG